jgi:hypothetical protein
MLLLSSQKRFNQTGSEQIDKYINKYIDIVKASKETESLEYIRDIYSRRFYSTDLCRKLIEIIKTEHPEHAARPRSATMIALTIIAEHSNADTPDDIIDFLATKITYYNPFNSVKREYVAPELDRPALLGLLRIGRNATKAVIRTVISTDDTSIINECSYFIYRYYGKDFAIILIEREHDRNKDLTARRRLERVRLYLLTHGKTE